MNILKEGLLVKISRHVFLLFAVIFWISVYEALAMNTTNETIQMFDSAPELFCPMGQVMTDKTNMPYQLFTYDKFLIVKVKNKLLPLEIYLDSKNDDISSLVFKINNPNEVERAYWDNRDFYLKLASQAKVDVSGDFLELKIPLEEINASPGPGDIIGYYILYRKGDKIYPQDAKTMYSWEAGRHVLMPDPRFFKKAVFKKDNKSSLDIRIFTRGRLSAFPEEAGLNIFNGTIINNGNTGKNIMVGYCQNNNNVTDYKIIKLKPGERRPVNIKYAVDHENDLITFFISDLDDKYAYYRSEWRVMPFPKLRVPIRSEFIGADLLTTNDAPPASCSLMTAHGKNKERMISFGLNLGQPWSLWDWYNMFGRLNLLSWAELYKPDTSDYNTLKVSAEYFRKTSTKAMMRLDRMSSEFLKEHENKGVWRKHDSLTAWMLDPVVQEKIIESIREAGKYKDIIAGVSFGDERYVFAYEGGVRFLQNCRGKYEFIDRCYDEIKKNYGIEPPLSFEEKDRLKWLAYRLFFINKMDEWEKRFVSETKKIFGENIRMASDDSRAGNYPWMISRWREYFNMIQWQCFPRRAGSRDVEFTVKLIRDLVGEKAAVIPCPHFENYPQANTLEELREIFSQILRAGGNGFDIFSINLRTPDLQGAELYYTNPLGWKYMEKVLGAFNAGLHVKALEANVYVYYSNYTFLSEVTPGNRTFSSPAGVHNLLAQTFGVWYRWLDEKGLKEKKFKKGDILMVPFAEVVDAELCEKIKEDLSGGLTLICFDPLGFSKILEQHPISLKDGDLIPTLLGPVKQSKAVDLPKGKALNLKYKDDKIKFEYPFSKGSEDRTFYFTGVPDDEKLIIDDQAKCYALRKQIKNGEIIIFGVNPFEGRQMHSEIEGGYETGEFENAWHRIISALLKDRNVVFNHPIWKVTFPLFDVGKFSLPEGVCLTGNGVAFFQENPITYKNAGDLGIRYRYTVAPDKVKDEAGITTTKGEAWIPIEKGNLTDRTDWLKHKKIKKHVEWENIDHCSVEFDLKNCNRLKNLSIIYSTVDPAIEVLSSVDGKTYKTIAAKSKGEAEKWKVYEFTSSIEEERQVRYLKINFNMGEKTESFVLAEIEIWADM